MSNTKEIRARLEAIKPYRLRHEGNGIVIYTLSQGYPGRIRLPIPLAEFLVHAPEDISRLLNTEQDFYWSKKSE